MLYTVKTGTTTTITRSSGIIGTIPTCSPKTILLTWLIYGLLPLTLTAGIGSKDMITDGPLLIPLAPSQQQTNGNNNNSSSVINITPMTKVASGNNNSSNDSRSNYIYYDCPTSCQCEYRRSSQKLEISCSSSTTSRSENAPASSSNQKIDLSAGIRTLRISHAQLVDSKSVGSIIPPIMTNTLVELDLEHVTIEPKSFFVNSLLFRESAQSLRKLTIRAGNLRGGGDTSITDLPAASIREFLQPLASLQSLDSLTICDSSHSLAMVVLQAMPAVKHLRAVNNALKDIPYESLTTNYHQYSVIESIDFSKNHLSLIPNGLLEGLTELRTLDVSLNRIFHLQEQVFTGLSALRKLNVSHNQIEYVDAEVFTPLQHIQTVDLSHNEVVQFFEPYFKNNERLEVLNLSNMWVTGTFNSKTVAIATRSLMEIEKLISTLHRVEKLDISDNGMIRIPETLTHAPNLQQVEMDGNKWECSCQDRWVLDWIDTTKVSVNAKKSPMWCYSKWNTINPGEIVKFPFYEHLKNLTRSCSNKNIVATTPYKYYAVMGKNKQLNCHAQKPNWPKITWITPSKQRITENCSIIDSNNSSESLEQLELRNQLQPRVAPDGSLLLTNVTRVDYGLYLCIASYQDLNITHYVHLGMDVSIFRDVRLTSIIVGWTFSFGFLLLVLLFQLVRFILDKLGVRCVTMNTTRQTRRVRAFFDSMEQHKTSQLDWLRDNYNMQAKKIKDNCYSQLERIRESYASKNLGEIRDFGTQSLNTLRDQYNDQVRKVANYSAHQLCKVRENYVFKRNQVCKFSNHQLLRLRETYKWQAQTLNKILENLPRGLNFDTCRGMGACGRTDSIYLDDFGDEFGCMHHDVQAEVFHMSSGLHHHHHLMGFPASGTIDKMEHVSLLIPPEFVNEYRQNAAAEGIEHPLAIPEEELDDDEAVGVGVSKEAAAAEAKRNARKQSKKKEDKTVVVKQAEEVEEASTTPEDSSSSTSTLPTVTLESSTSSRSGSYSSENPPQSQPPPDNNDATTTITITNTDNVTTERHDNDV